MNNLIKQIEFIKEIDKLKYIKRKTRLFGSERHENDAEHSWHIAVMAMVLAEHANEPVNVARVIKMLLIHDIVEIDAGDVFLFDARRDDTADAEAKAADRLFGMLPQHQADEFKQLWHEFEDAQTPEAKFAHSIDRLEPVMQNDSNQGGTWGEFDVPYDKVISKVSIMDHGSNTLWDFAQGLINKFFKK